MKRDLKTINTFTITRLSQYEEFVRDRANWFAWTKDNPVLYSVNTIKLDGTQKGKYYMQATAYRRSPMIRPSFGKGAA